MKVKYLFLFIVFIGVSRTAAQDKWALSECLRAAYQANHLLKAVTYQEQQARMQLNISKAQRLPVVNMLSGYTRIGRLTTIEFSTSPDAPPRKLTFGTPNRMNLDVRLQMPLFTWQRIKNSIRLATLGLQMNSLEKEKQKLSLTAQVLQAYYGALFGKKILELTRQNVQRTEEYLNITQRRYAAGQLPKLELLRARVKLKNEQSRLQSARAEYEKSLAFLARVTGKSPGSIEPDGQIKFVPLTVDEHEYVQRALEKRPELRQLHGQKAMLATQQKIAGAGNKPNLGLVSSYSVMNGFDPMNPEKFYTNYNIGLQLSWPLFDGFKARFQAQGLYYNQKALEEQTKEIEENIKLQIRQALISLKQATQKIESQKANIELASEALSLAQKQYNQGVISSLDLLDAQKALLQTEMAYWQAVFSHILAKIELCKATANFSVFEDQM